MDCDALCVGWTSSPSLTRGETQRHSKDSSVYRALLPSYLSRAMEPVHLGIMRYNYAGQSMHAYSPHNLTICIGVQVLIGNREWMSVNGIDVVMGMEDKIQVWETQGRTVVLVSVDGELSWTFTQIIISLYTPMNRYPCWCNSHCRQHQI